MCGEEFSHLKDPTLSVQTPVKSSTAQFKKR
jgi:hypothetical protein